MQALLRASGPVVSALLIAAAFVISLFFNGGQSWLYAPALFCLLAGLLIPLLWPGRIQKPFGWFPFLFIALSAYITVSLTWSQTPFPSLVTWLVYCCLPLCFFGLSLSARRDDFIKSAVIALQIAIAGLGAWGVIDVLSRHHPRAGYPLDDANNFAALMNLGLLPALAVAFTTRGRLFYLSGAAALAEFGGLIATESRGGFLCFALGAIILAALLHRQIQPFLRRNMMFAAILGILFAAISFHAPDGGTVARLSSLRSVTQDEAAMNRPVLWRATLHMIAERPWTGTGLGSFYMAYPSHRPVSDRVSAGQWAHNDPLQFAAEMGMAALILFYAFAGGIAARSCAALKTARDPMVAGLSCGVFTLILHAHIEFQLYLMPVLIVLGAWLADWYRRGAMLLPAGASWKSVPLNRAQTLIYRTAIIAVAALLALPAYKSAAASYYLNSAIAAMQKLKPQTFVSLLDKADAVAPDSFIDARVQRAGLYIDLLTTPDGMFDGKNQQAMEQYVQTALEVAEKTMPMWSEVNDKRAAYYTAMKSRLGPDWEKHAESEYEIALRKNPLDTKARARLVELLMNRGDADDAYRLLNEGLERPHPSNDQADMLALQAKLKHMADLKKQYEEHAP